MHSFHCEGYKDAYVSFDDDRFPGVGILGIDWSCKINSNDIEDRTWRHSLWRKLLHELGIRLRC